MTTLNGATWAVDTDAPPADVREQARELYRASLRRGEPLTREQLGAAFDKSSSWGRDRIAEVRAESDMSGDTGDMDMLATPEPVVVAARAAGTPDAVDAQGDNLPVTRDMSPSVAPTTVAVPPADTPVVDAAPDNRGDMSPDTAADSPDMPDVSHHAGARFVCWLGFTLGTLVSVVANWLAAWLPAAQHGPGWAPDPWSQGFAAVWPVALLVSVEVLSRIAWPSGVFYGFVRYGGMVAVALSSGVISYGHIHAVLLAWGYGALGAAVGPLVIDGLMVVSGFGLLVLSKSRNKR